MIVTEDHGRRVVRKRALDDLARIHGRAVDRPAEQLLVADQPVPRVEEQTTEHFVRQIEQPGLEEARRVLGRRQRAARLERRAEVAPAELERGREARGARGSRTLRACQLGAVRCRAAPSRPPRSASSARASSAGRLAARAGAEQDREQLAVRQSLRARLEQPLAGPFRWGPAAQLHALLRRSGSHRRASASAAAAAISPRRHKKSSIRQWHAAKNRE